MTTRMASVFGWMALSSSLALGCTQKSPPPEALAAAPTPAKSETPAISSLPETCTEICEHSHVLRCAHAEQCLTNCVAAASGTPCNSEFSGFYRCAAKEPAKSWECGEDGVAALRPGLCDGEQQRAIACMEQKASL